MRRQHIEIAGSQSTSQPLTADFLEYVADICGEVPFGEGPVQICGYDMYVFETPGHSPGSSVLYFGDEGVAFFGDLVAPGFTGIPRTNLPNSNVPQLIESINRMAGIGFDPSTMCFFGHGESMTMEELCARTFMSEPLTLGTLGLLSGDAFDEVEGVCFADGKIMVPILNVAAAAGAEVEVDGGTYSVAFADGRTLVVKAGSATAQINGVNLPLDLPVMRMGDDVLVEGCWLGEFLTKTLNWAVQDKQFQAMIATQG